jgi:hypothetical protein
LIELVFLLCCFVPLAIILLDMLICIFMLLQWSLSPRMTNRNHATSLPSLVTRLEWRTLFVRSRSLDPVCLISSVQLNFLRVVSCNLISICWSAFSSHVGSSSYYWCIYDSFSFSIIFILEAYYCFKLILIYTLF